MAESGEGSLAFSRVSYLCSFKDLDKQESRPRSCSVFGINRRIHIPGKGALCLRGSLQPQVAFTTGMFLSLSIIMARDWDF